jgi:hypothetical protein
MGEIRRLLDLQIMQNDRKLQRDIDIDCISIRLPVISLSQFGTNGLLLGKKSINFDDPRLSDLCMLLVEPYVVCIERRFRASLAQSLEQIGICAELSNEESFFTNDSLRICHFHLITALTAIGVTDLLLYLYGAKLRFSHVPSFMTSNLVHCSDNRFHLGVEFYFDNSLVFVDEVSALNLRRNNDIIQSVRLTPMFGDIARRGGRICFDLCTPQNRSLSFDIHPTISHVLKNTFNGYVLIPQRKYELDRFHRSSKACMTALRDTLNFAARGLRIEIRVTASTLDEARLICEPYLRWDAIQDLGVVISSVSFRTFREGAKLAFDWLECNRLFQHRLPGHIHHAKRQILASFANLIGWSTRETLQLGCSREFMARGGELRSGSALASTDLVSRWERIFIRHKWSVGGVGAFHRELSEIANHMSDENNASEIINWLDFVRVGRGKQYTILLSNSRFWHRRFGQTLSIKYHRDAILRGMVDAVLTYHRLDWMHVFALRQERANHSLRFDFSKPYSGIQVLKSRVLIINDFPELILPEEDDLSLVSEDSLSRMQNFSTDPYSESAGDIEGSQLSFGSGLIASMLEGRSMTPFTLRERPQRKNFNSEDDRVIMGVSRQMHKAGLSWKSVASWADWLRSNPCCHSADSLRQRARFLMTRSDN